MTYTPNTHEIRAGAFFGRFGDISDRGVTNSLTEMERIAVEEFDRWLAEELRKAQETAWDQGYEARDTGEFRESNPYG